MVLRFRRWPLSFKLLVVTELMLLVAIVATLVPVRSAIRDQVEADLQAKLQGIASTGALQLSGDDIAHIRQTGDENSDAFKRQEQILDRIRVANGLPPEQIYTLYRDGDIARFGVMTHTKPFVGSTLKLNDYLREAFTSAKNVVTRLYEDEHGQWISAFAPIHDSSGKMVGILEVDEKAEMYFERYRQVQAITAVIAIAALGIASVLGLWVVDFVVLKPMRAVHTGMRALSRQDFSHRVNLKTKDEFEDLALVLNDLSRQLNAARQVAAGFTPKELPTPQGWQIAALTEPCEATAGDYFDVFELPSGDTAVLVADVTGHGLGPSLHMSACRSALRALASTGFSPAQLIERLDLLLQDDLEGGRFITMIYGVLEKSGRFTFSNAGHGPALLWHADEKRLRVLDSYRPPLGVPCPPIGDHDPETTIQLRPGDRLLMCSDGVPEAMSPAGTQLGNEVLEEMLRRDGVGPTELVAELKRRVLAHCGAARPHDDVTILFVERTADVESEGNGNSHAFRHRTGESTEPSVVG
jgi:serine phosphatase RsbU (regulator of sigma subunit)